MSQKQDHSELINTVLSGARWATVLRLGAQVFSWLSTFIVVRLISPEDYGLNAMLESPMVLMMMLSTLGLDTALVQVKKTSTDELRSAFGWLLLLNGALFLVYFFGGAVLAAYFKEPRLDLLAKVLAFVFVLVPFRVIPNALLDRDLDFKFRAQLEIAATIVSIIATLILAYLGAGIWALVTNILLSRVLLIILLMIYKPWFILPKLNLGLVKGMISNGWIITFSSLLALLSDQLISIIAGPKLGAALLGVFAVGSQFAAIPLSKGMPIINQIMLPAFSKLQDDRAAATYYLERLLGVMSLAFFPMLIGLSCVADKLVMAILGVKWMESILPLTSMSLGMLFRLNTTLLKNVMAGIGRNDLPLKANFLQLILMLPLLIYLVDFGVNGVVAAWLVTEILVAIVTIQFSKMVLDTTYRKIFSIYRPALVASAIMASCVLGIKALLSNQHDMMVFCVAVSSGVLSYYLSTRLLFLKEYRLAFKTILGDRFKFLNPD